MADLPFNRSHVWLDMRCSVFPYTPTRRTVGIPFKDGVVEVPRRDRRTFWGFGRPYNPIQPIPKAGGYAGCQRGKAKRSLATRGSGENPPDWFRELQHEFDFH